MADTVKLTVNITGRELAELRAQADRNGTTVTEALRRSLAAGRAFDDARTKGARVLVEGPAGRLRQVEVI